MRLADHELVLLWAGLFGSGMAAGMAIQFEAPTVESSHPITVIAPHNPDTIIMRIGNTELHCFFEEGVR